MATGNYKVIDTGYKSHSKVRFSLDGNIYCGAGSPDKFVVIIRINSETEKVSVCELFKFSGQNSTVIVQHSYI